MLVLIGVGIGYTWHACQCGYAVVFMEEKVAWRMERDGGVGGKISLALVACWLFTDGC